MSNSVLEPPLRSPELTEHFKALTGVMAMGDQRPQRPSEEIPGEKKREFTGGGAR